MTQGFPSTVVLPSAQKGMPMDTEASLPGLSQDWLSRRPENGVASRGKNAPCTHNSWDNVRVIKGQVTLRCRLCQVQWRTHVDAVWRKRKCGFFNTAQGCSLGEACPKVHMYTKKQSLEERVVHHGANVLSHVPVQVRRKRQHKLAPAITTDNDSTSLDDATTPSSTPTNTQRQNKIHYTRPCTHAPWDNVRIKNGVATLKCRVCQSFWRQSVDAIPRCERFPDCPLGDTCSKVHIWNSAKNMAHLARTNATNTTPTPTPTPIDTPHKAEVWNNGLALLWPATTLSDGTQAWYDSGATFSHVGAWTGATLLQGTSLPVQCGASLMLRLTSTVPTCRATVHIAHNGSYSTALEMHGWARTMPASPLRVANQSLIVHSFLTQPALLPGGMFALPQSGSAHDILSVFVIFEEAEEVVQDTTHEPYPLDASRNGSIVSRNGSTASIVSTESEGSEEVQEVSAVEENTSGRGRRMRRGNGESNEPNDTSASGATSSPRRVPRCLSRGSGVSSGSSRFEPTSEDEAGQGVEGEDRNAAGQARSSSCPPALRG